MRTYSPQIPTFPISTFGMVMEARSWQATSTDTYRFGFNGKEEDNEVTVDGGTIAFEARIYDSRICRFLSCDPMEAEYRYQSTYVFAHNCPISLIDFLGMGDPPKNGEEREVNGCWEYWDAVKNNGKGSWCDAPEYNLPEVTVVAYTPPDPSICIIDRNSIKLKPTPQIQSQTYNNWATAKQELSMIATINSMNPGVSLLSMVTLGAMGLCEETYVGAKSFTTSKYEIYGLDGMGLSPKEVKDAKQAFGLQLGLSFMGSGLFAPVANATTQGTIGYRYMSQLELDAIQETGFLRGGLPGENYFTKDLYKSAVKAQYRLALPNKPVLRVEFEILNNPMLIRNGTKVVPNGSMMGQGSEFMTTHPVNVKLINSQPIW